MSLRVGTAASEESTDAASEYTPGKTAAIAEKSALSTDFLRAERNQKMPPPVLTFSASCE